MIDVRRTSDDCLTCGSQIPPEIEKVVGTREIEYRCPDCSWTVATGSVLVGPDYEHMDSVAPENTPTHHSDPEPYLPETTRYGVWEKWWTARGVVTAINGRVVAGSDDLYKLVEHLEDIHGSS